MSPKPSDLDVLNAQRYVSLTTFRRTGAAVPTPVWIARDGAELVVVSVDPAGKLKRLAHTARVELRPCTRRGAVPDGAPVVRAVASMEAPSDRPVGALRRKYGVEYRIIMTLERMLSRGRRERVILRIRLDRPTS